MVSTGKRTAACSHVDGFAHEALLYEGEAGFVDGTLPFVREGLDAGEAILVAVPAAHAGPLREALGEEAELVRFANVERLGRNPGRIIPAWRDFLDEHTAEDRAVRGIGEPIWPERTEAELAECQRHETLLNLAFDDRVPWTLLCPYDAANLDDEVVEEAMRSHPVLREDGRSIASGAYLDPADVLASYDDDLPPPPVVPERLEFGRFDVAAVRATVSHHAAAAGLAADRRADAVLAASEAATNSVLHGGGRGRAAVWREGGTVVCEVRDRGRIHDALAGRRRPTLDALDGRGLWIVHQLCDLVEVRHLAEGTVVRFRIGR